MILQPRDLENYRYFEENTIQRVNKHYNRVCEDVITLFYSKKTEGFFGEKEKTWKREIVFNRAKNSEGLWALNNDTLELKAQLKAYNEGTWHAISQELYDKIQIEYPEEFL